jgi:SynChlorMet cassette radical SAM/SPASM protein ScmE
LDEIGLPGFSTNEAFSCGATNRTVGGIMLTPSQRLRAMRTLTDLATRYDGRINAQAGPLALAREFKMIDEELQVGHTSVEGRGRLCGCGGVFNKIAVLHDGTIVPCHNLSTLRMGMIGVDDLRKVWLEHPMINAVRKRREIPLSSLESCRDCSYQGFCTGGCPGGAVFLSGELNARDPSGCYRVHKGEDPDYTSDWAVT